MTSSSSPELWLSDLRYRALVENAAEGVIVLDAHGRIVYANPAVINVTGYSSDDLSSRDAFENVHPEDLALCRAAVTDAMLAAGSRMHAEFRYRHKDGGWRWLDSVLVSRFHESAIGGIVANFRDITEHVYMMQALRVQGEIGRLLADATNADAVRPALLTAIGETLGARAVFEWREGPADVLRCAGAWAHDHDPGAAEFARASLVRSFARGEGIVGRVLSTNDAITVADVTEDPSYIGREAAAAGGVRAAMLVPLPSTAPGNSGVLEVAWGHRFHANDRLVETMVMTGRQIGYFADRIQTRAQLAARDAQLRDARKMELVGRLAGGIAHDFNNLLTAILGYAELLHENLPSDSPLRQDAGEILKVAGSASGVVRQLLAFSRRQVLQTVVFDMNDIVRGMERMLRRLIGEHIVLRTSLHGAPLLARADVVQVEQVLLNLAVNARDAMPSGGDLTITASPASVTGDDPDLPLNPGEYIRLSVRDTGVGMDEDTLDHMFEPFFTTKASGGGTGLGLATVYGIVQQSGGHVRVSSSPGAGSTFDVYLPASQEPVDARSQQGRAKGGSETVLVVEDEPTVRRLACEVLRRAGYRVLEAPGGHEACAVADAHDGPIHLLLTDIVMPGMSGGRVAEILTARRAEMRVVYCSGYADDTVRPEGVARGGQPLLPKPYTTAALLGKVRETLG